MKPLATGRSLGPLVADLVCVLALAVGGANAHDGGESYWVVLVIMWPFAVAAGLAHAWLGWRGRQSRQVWPEGVVVLAVTYVLGMALRVVSDRGIAPAFLVVAALVLAVTMLGWRFVVQIASRRLKTPSSRSRPSRRVAITVPLSGAVGDLVRKMTEQITPKVLSAELGISDGAIRQWLRDQGWQSVPHTRWELTSDQAAQVCAHFQG